MVCDALVQQHRQGAGVLHLSGGGDEHGRQIHQLRDGGHAFGGEHAAARQLPVPVLLHQHSSNQAGDLGIVGQDADHPGWPLYFLIMPLQQVGAPVLFPVLLREVKEGQQVFSGLVH